jgi:hypothetical protein
VREGGRGASAQFACIGVTRFSAAGRDPVDPFGFSWLVAVLLRAFRFCGLDFLGFPWILSSESRLFNGLRGL